MAAEWVQAWNDDDEGRKDVDDMGDALIESDGELRGTARGMARPR